MEIIIHRVNTIKKLKSISNNFGTEIDIRSSSSKLILSHDPFAKGDSLENYLSEYKKKKRNFNSQYKRKGYRTKRFKIGKKT